MSHYHVNASVPKTLIQHLIRWIAHSGQFDEGVSIALHSILDTEISPELVPASEGEPHGLQSSEETVGPFELQVSSLLHHALWLSPEQSGVSRAARVGQSRERLHESNQYH
jgi:NAD+ synthase (glutamine-hydrolysing)